MLLLHHDDDVREYAYDRESPVARLDRAAAEAGARHWTVVSIKRDFREVFGSYGAERPANHSRGGPRSP
jgi:hypothetical protein